MTRGVVVLVQAFRSRPETDLDGGNIAFWRIGFSGVESPATAANATPEHTPLNIK